MPKACAYLLFLLIAALIVASNVSAQDCFADSPSLADGQSPSDPIIVRELSRSEHDHLERLFKSLSGKWEGRAEDMECKGGIDSPSINRTSYTIKAQAKTNRNGDIRLETELFSEERRTSHTEVTEFYLSDQKLRHEMDSGGGDVQLIEITKDRVKFLKRGNFSGGWYGGNTKREIFVSLSVGRNSFSIESRFYIQGRFTLHRVRHFKR